MPLTAYGESRRKHYRRKALGFQVALGATVLYTMGTAALMVFVIVTVVLSLFS